MGGIQWRRECHQWTFGKNERIGCRRRKKKSDRTQNCQMKAGRKNTEKEMDKHKYTDPAEIWGNVGSSLLSGVIYHFFLIFGLNVYANLISQKNQHDNEMENGDPGGGGDLMTHFWVKILYLSGLLILTPFISKFRSRNDQIKLNLAANVKQRLK